MESTDSTLNWVKSSLSFSNGNCVEVAGLTDGIVVRNSKDPLGPVLQFTLDEWRAFVGGIRNGEFDRFALLWRSDTLFAALSGFTGVTRGEGLPGGGGVAAPPPRYLPSFHTYA